MEDSKVAVILEDLRSQFKVFGEGLQFVIERVGGVEGKIAGIEGRLSGVEGRLGGVEGKLAGVEYRLTKVEDKLDAHIEENRREFALNRLEHKQMMQMIKEVDKQVQVELKRVK